MVNEIRYNKDDDFNIISDTFKMKDVNGKRFSTETWYLHNNVKINLDIFPLIIEAGIVAQKVLYYIMANLKRNTNVISINRKDALIFLGSKDPALLTNGIKKLKDLGIIVPLEKNSKNDYYVPLNNIVRGNVNTMISKLKEEEEEQERIEKEQASIKSYKEITDRHKIRINKHNIK